MKKVLKKVFWFFVVVFGSTLFGVVKIIEFLAKIAAKPSNDKEYQPTSHEIRCGQKYFFSDKYFVPDEKPPK